MWDTKEGNGVYRQVMLCDGSCYKAVMSCGGIRFVGGCSCGEWQINPSPGGAEQEPKVQQLLRVLG
ncbi:TPA: hypothetical protein SMI12_002143 [Serratia liquefaciens]|uniref:hypothetical protein n=1 Tax=Serratia proteamaculans TaxID=28151 RepID=UPI0021778BCE|nr:hypothetical protein [Serratia proteamaculans]CAI1209065.1 Uncharacterised protein [Serratia proteamaculans]HEJ7885191.1 hypothetical protein [Serratia liquefaciens]